MNNVEKKIIGLIYEITESKINNVLNEHSSLTSDYHLDSLSLVTLLLRIEDEFNISIDFDSLELSDFSTVHMLANLIKNE